MSQQCQYPAWYHRQVQSLHCHPHATICQGKHLTQTTTHNTTTTSNTTTTTTSRGCHSGASVLLLLLLLLPLLLLFLLLLLQPLLPLLLLLLSCPPILRHEGKIEGQVLTVRAGEYLHHKYGTHKRSNY
jgi:hypothetical protein